jgi:PhnB protein
MPVPEGYHSVTPFVIVKGAARFLDFMADAFDAHEIARVLVEDGSIGHAESRIGDSVVMAFDAKDDWPETPAFLRLYVDDCEASYEQALEAGATSVTRPTDMPWGDRVARVRDPLGNLWWLMTRFEDVSIEEMERRYGEQKYIDAMAYVQNAEFFPPGGAQSD